jgi:hypothetical protein
MYGGRPRSDDGTAVPRQLATTRPERDAPGRLVVIGSLVLVLVNVLEPGFVHVRMFVRVAAAVFVLVLVLDVLVIVRRVGVRMRLAVVLVPVLVGMG